MFIIAEWPGNCKSKDNDRINGKDIDFKLANKARYQLLFAIDACQFPILSWRWLDIWFQPMGWLFSAHLMSINSAIMTCQPQPASHDLCISTY